MPMFDYFCATCKNHFERFYRTSCSPSLNPACARCNGLDTSAITDLSITLNRHRVHSDAQRFQPVIVDRRLDPVTRDWVYSYPGASDAPLDSGYERLQFNSIAQIDRHCKDQSAKEKELNQYKAVQEKAYWDQRTKERREVMRENMIKAGISHSRIGDLVAKRTDEKRERKHDERMRRDPEFRSQAFNMDASNRQGHDDPSKRKLYFHTRSR